MDTVGLAYPAGIRSLLGVANLANLDLVTPGSRSCSVPGPLILRKRISLRLPNSTKGRTASMQSRHARSPIAGPPSARLCGGRSGSRGVLQHSTDHASPTTFCRGVYRGDLRRPAARPSHSDASNSSVHQRGRGCSSKNVPGRAHAFPPLRSPHLRAACSLHAIVVARTLSDMSVDRCFSACSSSHTRR